MSGSLEDVRRGRDGSRGKFGDEVELRRSFRESATLWWLNASRDSSSLHRLSRTHFHLFFEQHDRDIS